MIEAEIKKLANLARIEVSPEEAVSLSKDVTAILGYVAKVKEVAAAAPEGQDEGLGPVDVLRDDADPLPRGAETEKLLASAPQSKDGFVKVQKVL
ncbi:MAG TPA: Asp-tRNA(Asn)/Glu-tRNA(Gln) amidotransferase subunit GatC [Candidatus Paceibacterota bacterium]